MLRSAKREPVRSFDPDDRFDRFLRRSLRRVYRRAQCTAQPAQTLNTASSPERGSNPSSFCVFSIRRAHTSAKVRSSSDISPSCGVLVLVGGAVDESREKSTLFDRPPPPPSPETTLKSTQRCGCLLVRRVVTCVGALTGDLRPAYEAQASNWGPWLDIDRVPAPVNSRRSSRASNCGPWLGIERMPRLCGVNESRRPGNADVSRRARS